jgi:tRNA (guanine9-N1)-methyltransferase
VSQQFSFCYNANRKSSTPCHVHITSFGGKTKKDIEGKFEYQKWKNVVVDEKPYIDLFDRTKLVYLTADSTNVLEDLNPEHYYIIGAIVDHNRLKNATKLLADQQGIATARLPIDEHLKLSTRKVLTINHGMFSPFLPFNSLTDPPLFLPHKQYLRYW